jgi:hypothetical protein
MKVRNGFVSNSSSGSFILHWRVKSLGEEISTQRAVGRVFGISSLENGELDWSFSLDREIKPTIDKIIEKTVQNSDGTFTTTFWTSMVNSEEDFGDEAKSFVMRIFVDSDDNFAIIDKKVEADY